jgi:hypothetical protein
MSHINRIPRHEVFRDFHIDDKMAGAYDSVSTNFYIEIVSYSRERVRGVYLSPAHYGEYSSDAWDSIYIGPNAPTGASRSEFSDIVRIINEGFLYRISRSAFSKYRMKMNLTSYITQIGSLLLMTDDFIQIQDYTRGGKHTHETILASMVEL